VAFRILTERLKSYPDNYRKRVSSSSFRVFSETRRLLERIGHATENYSGYGTNVNRRRVCGAGQSHEALEVLRRAQVRDRISWIC